jgi:hypothetical protein
MMMMMMVIMMMIDNIAYGNREQCTDIIHGWDPRFLCLRRVKFLYCPYKKIFAVINVWLKWINTRFILLHTLLNSENKR